MKCVRAASRVFLLALAGLVSAPGLAQVDTSMAAAAITPVAKKDGDSPWSGTLGAGYAKTSGNSDSSAANAKGEVRYDRNRWHHILGGTAIGQSSAASRDEDSRTTAEAYWIGYKAQYDFTAAVYGFGSVDWYKDLFSAYDQQLYEAAGLGWRILRGETHFLDLEAGAGARQADLQSGESQDETIGLLRGIYTWQISPNAKFVQKLAVLTGSDNTYTEASSELKAGILGNLSLVLGYTYKHNSDVEDDLGVDPVRPFDKTDTFTTISLEYGF